MNKIVDNIDFGIKSGQEKARLNKMQDDALESMRTGREGYFWFNGEIDTMKKGSIFIMLTPSSQKILFKYEVGGLPYDNFSFTDPRPSEAPPVYMPIWTINMGDYWLVISSGHFGKDGKLFVYSGIKESKENLDGFTIDQWWLELPEEAKIEGL